MAYDALMAKIGLGGLGYDKEDGLGLSGLTLSKVWSSQAGGNSV